MALSITIAVLSCATLMGVILIKPSVQIKGKSFDIYWIIPLATAIIVLCLRQVGFIDLKNAFLSSDATNPIKILVLFFSMSLISIYLDETGFFNYIASVAVKSAHSSQKRLFVIFYIAVSLLTIFTSNDIVILTFTPFICKFSKHAKINAIPYVVCEFVAANTWSMLFVIGNPTNVFLSSAYAIDFLTYLKFMFIPTIFCGISTFVTLFLVFRKQLLAPIVAEGEEVELFDKKLASIGLVHLALATVFLAVSSYLKVEMWIVSLVFAVSLCVFVFGYRIIKRQKPTILLKTGKRLPYQLAPTVIGMFVLVLALKNQGVSAKLSEILGNDNVIFSYGTLSTLFSNVMNNIPMSVFFSSVAPTNSLISAQKALYSTVIGSNLGAILTPLGALAGVMLMSILKRHEVKFRFVDFVKYGVILTPIALISSLSGLYLSFLIF